MHGFQRTTLIMLLLASVFCVSSSFANLQPHQYQVELIVFSHINAKGLNSEYWPAYTPIALNNSKIISLSSSNNTVPGNAFTLLPKNEFRLNREAERIASRPGYKLLLHIAWRQTFTNPAPTEFIHLYGGNTYTNSNNTANNWQLNGILSISVNRYFNVNFNLNLAEPANQIQRFLNRDNQNNVLNHFAYFRFSQSRRMRSNELNYFGHPLYGIIMKISKVPTPAVTQTVPTQMG